MCAMRVRRRGCVMSVRLMAHDLPLDALARLSMQGVMSMLSARVSFQ
jgi:hypothetical protein